MVLKAADIISAKLGSHYSDVVEHVFHELQY